MQFGERRAAKIERVGDGNQAPVFVLRQQHSDGPRSRRRASSSLAKEAGTMRSVALSERTDRLTG